MDSFKMGALDDSEKCFYSYMQFGLKSKIPDVEVQFTNSFT